MHLELKNSITSKSGVDMKLIDFVDTDKSVGFKVHKSGILQQKHSHTHIQLESMARYQNNPSDRSKVVLDRTFINAKDSRCYVWNAGGVFNVPGTDVWISESLELWRIKTKDEFHHTGITKLAKIGSGQYGSVYKCKYLERVCAVKIMKFTPRDVAVSGNMTVITSGANPVHEINMSDALAGEGIVNTTGGFVIHMTDPDEYAGVMIMDYAPHTFESVVDKLLGQGIAEQQYYDFLSAVLERLYRTLNRVHDIPTYREKAAKFSLNDIKPNNILVMFDGDLTSLFELAESVVFADFSLTSPFPWKIGIAHAGLYRAPELRDAPSETKQPGDIWALSMVGIWALAKWQDRSNPDGKAVTASAALARTPADTNIHKLISFTLINDHKRRPTASKVVAFIDQNLNSA